MSMATPLMSDKARAWLSSVKGVPPNQISQHAIHAAQTGMISFGDAIALKQMADKLSGAAAQQNAPSPTSVVQDLKQQVQSKDMYGGVGSLPTSAAPAPAASPMESGLASLPAPVMDDAQYAGGGIVAFASAGPVSGAAGEFAGIEQAEIEDEVKRFTEKQAKGSPLSPAEQTRFQRLKSFLNRPVTLEGAKSVLKSATVGPAARLAQKAGVVGGVAEAAFGQGDVNIDRLRQYYIDKGYSPEDIGGFMLTDYAAMPEEKRPFYAPLADPALRLSAAADTALNRGTFGLAGILGVDAPYSEIAKQDAAAAAAAPKPAAGPDLSKMDLAQFFDKDSGSGGPSLGSMRGADAGMRTFVESTRSRVPKEWTAEDRKKAIKDKELEDAAAGIGKADERAEALRQQEMEELKAQKYRDPRMALAEAGFSMAAAASQPGSSFLGSAAQGATTGMKAYKDALAQQRLAQKDLNKSELDIMRSKEARKAGHIAKADALETRAIEQREKGLDRLNAAELAFGQMQFEGRKAEYMAQAQLAASKIANKDTAEQFMSAYRNAVSQGKFAEAEELLKRLTAAMPGVAAARAQADAAAAAAGLPGTRPANAAGSGQWGDVTKSQ